MVENRTPLQWALETLNSQEIITMPVPQVIRSMPWSEVIRIPTSHGNIILKFSIPAFSNEASLLQFFESKGVAGVPKVIASNPELSCFLMKDLGVPLRTYIKDNFVVEPIEKAVALYTDIQKKSLNLVDSLLELGVKDCRPRHLSRLFVELLEDEPLLLDDGLTSLEIEKLAKLAPTIDGLCDELESFNIPPSIEHGDFHDNNILINDGQLTIIDWGDASISHPFFSCVSFLDSLKRNHALDQKRPEYALIKDAYLEAWKDYASPPNITRAFNLATVLRNIPFALNFKHVLKCKGTENHPELRGYVANALRQTFKYEQIVIKHGPT